ncbi:MAG: hypothetical protein A2Y17_02490 [Clostridiales bacterium GWF2_38_85]|nr:MAG: hypothetical protein A2Y17_02490 [Clostridiales bacterium GWF2_38_85]HBL85066.1 hypothetical protein [Clostridiales bacterium]
MSIVYSFEFNNFTFHHALDSATEWTKPQFTLHVHNTYEIYFLIGGRVSYLIEGVRYELEPGSLLLIKPGIIHGYQIHEGEPYERYTFHFNEDFLFSDYREVLKTPFINSVDNPCRHYSGKPTIKVQELFEMLEKVEETQRANIEMKARLLAHYIIDEIYSITQKQSSDIREPADEAVSEIIKYINSEFAEPISLNMLSDKFFIDKNHINRLFKKATGTTVKEYIIRKRIVYAKQLMSCGLTAAEASEKAGFNDYSAFYRAYINIIGHTPISDRSRK